MQCLLLLTNGKLKNEMRHLQPFKYYNGLINEFNGKKQKLPRQMLLLSNGKLKKEVCPLQLLRPHRKKMPGASFVEGSRRELAGCVAGVTDTLNAPTGPGMTGEPLASAGTAGSGCPKFPCAPSAG